MSVSVLSYGVNGHALTLWPAFQFGEGRQRACDEMSHIGKLTYFKDSKCESKDSKFEPRNRWQNFKDSSVFSVIYTDFDSLTHGKCSLDCLPVKPRGEVSESANRT